MVEDDFRWGARVSVGLDRLVEDFSLDSMAYYHRGLDGEMHERVGAGLILGASLLTARGIPTVGEYELRTSLAMLLLDRIGAGGSFTELQALNFHDDVVEMGHDGPAHLAISARKPLLRGLGVYHGKRGWGVSVEFDVDHGPVTVCGLAQDRDGTFSLVASEGTTVPGPLLQIGNTTSRVDFGRDPGEWTDEWSATGIAHHWGLGTGHRVEELRAVADLLGLRPDRRLTWPDTTLSSAWRPSTSAPPAAGSWPDGWVPAPSSSRRCTASPTAASGSGARSSGTCWASIARCSPACARSRATGPLDGIGIDSWAIDHGLLDRDGQLLGNPYSHRDTRTDGVAERVAAQVGAAEQYAVTGLQQLPFTTVYQLVAARDTAAFGAAETMLLLPDLLGFWLTGHVGAERTNASTTGLYDVRSREWALDLVTRLGLPPAILPPLRDPGDLVGTVLPEVAEALGLADEVPVVAVGSHDTASAVVGVPAEGPPGDGAAYISSGTWSLVGLELDQPVLTEDARLADFTNEGGVDGTVRFLKNVMGLWVLSESVRTWRDRGVAGADLATVLAAAAGAEALRTVVDINHPSLLAPGDLPARVQRLAEDAGEPVPRTPAEVTRCILDSLALAYRRHLRTAARLADRELGVVHVVGGGVRNELLCQLTADALGVPVLAGPAEAAALGNVLVQARTLGADLPDLAAMRALVRSTHELRRFEPTSGLDWDAAEKRLEGHR